MTVVLSLEIFFIIYQVYSMPFDGDFILSQRGNFEKLRITLIIIIEIIHHINDFVYTFIFPHYSGFIAGILLFSILVPMWSSFVTNYDESKRDHGYYGFCYYQFVDEESLTLRLFPRAIFTSFVHVIIQILEAFSFGYKWSNYFGGLPMYTAVFIFYDYA